ncbi:hypothetical protein [Actinoplanes sp. NPDC051411]|uniref:hypothetical protein n=1 Tax=Actinoplanes sp. NPDC051411 TaxID=3155522 RepID=UPI00341BEE42
MQSSPPIGAITDDYFHNPGYIGKVVTVTGRVTRVITPTSFVLTGQEFDDDSILVLSSRQPVPEGSMVTVTGEVQRFRYTTFSGDYHLPGVDRYRSFNGEEFLIAHAIQDVVTPTPAPAKPSATSS